ncbi:non-ribosomal peptide synthetase, partial [Longimicrobium sp.]|uniref:non-ribosomal peptide synthetase n=1 Tax=Longimicrobium sp. TaxID=2029185 RepID=UPI002E32660A
TDLSGNPTVRELLARVREGVLQAQAHQDLPFERLVEALGVDRAAGRTPLFQALLAFQQNAEAAGLTMGGLDVQPLSSGAPPAKFDLTLSLADSGEGIGGGLSYRAELFDAATMERLVDHLGRVLTAMAANPGTRIADIALSSADETARLLAWSGRAADDEYRPVHEVFARQAARTPDAVAIRMGDDALTYGELDARANRLAHHLRALGVGPDVKVALCMERSLEMVVGLMGALKAGGAYVPLDLGYPAERLAFMARDARVRVLLTQERMLDALPAHSGTVVCLDRDRAEIERNPATAPETGVTADHLAYVIYTSGSTGTPKGTEVPHRAIPGFFRGADYVSWDAEQVHLQHASTSWDVLTLELWPSLMTGARTVLFPARASEPVLLGEQVAAHGVTILWLSSAYFNLIIDTCPEILAGVTQVMTGGESVSPSHVRRAQALYPEMRLVNGYGPSECTVFASAYVIPAGFEGAAVPIGTPVGDRRVYLVDDRMRLSPRGVPGELCIGGPAVARGYLGQPGMTADRWVPDPFAAEAGARMYRTGDRVRWLNDGTLEFVGRVDFQAKVRGFRVEPGEIEAALLDDVRVREAVVAVREDVPGDRRLVAYATAADGAALTLSELRSIVKQRLPEYMVPQAFVLLETMPISAHGKIDRRALPAPGAWTDEDAYVAPRTPTEALLAGLYADVLRVDRVGAEDDFFALGGHSLLATRLVSRVRQTFRVELPLRALFDAPTVAGLAATVDDLLRDGGAAELPPLVPVARDGALPLSFAQQRLWFIDQMDPGTVTYNIPFALRLRGALDGAVLERAMTEIARRHETLRTRFAGDGGAPVQVIDDARPVAIPVTDLRHLPGYERDEWVRGIAADEARRPFDLRSGPLFRAALLRVDDEEHALLVTLHHVISDGWSMGVLVREVSELYGAYGRGEESPLAELPVQYADFAAWQRGWLRGEVLDAQLAWWRGQLAGAPPLLELPTDRPRPQVMSDRAGTVPFAVDGETGRALQALARREGATLFMTLTAAWQLLLSRYSGQDDVTVGSPIAGRTRVETEGLIGFFVNTLVLRTDLSGAPTFRELLGRVRETTLGAYQHQDIPFEKLVEELAPERSLSHTPLFQVLFVLQNNERATLRLGDLAAEPLQAGEPTVKFDLSLGLGETEDGGLAGALAYRAELFDAPTVERMLEHFGALLRAVAAQPDHAAATLPLLGEAERRRVLTDWNATERAYDLDSTLHGRVQAQAARTPDAPAVQYGDDVLTYADLERRANQLANHLRSLGVGPEVRVGVCAERSPELVVALLGILKAGAAYVPVDPSYPADRIAYMLSDSAIPVLLTQDRLAGTLPAHGAFVVRLDSDWPWIASASEEAPAVDVGPDHLAYMIYTSGSTGRPKGAMNAHRGIVNRLLWMQEQYGLTADDVVLQKTPFSFDVSVWEFFWPLMTGAKLVLARPGGHGDPAYLAELIEARGITTLHFVPSMLQAFLDAGAGLRCGSLRRVMCSGEALGYELMERALDTLHTAGIHNLYGPTEAAVDVTHWTCERRPEGRRVPIGRPVANTRMFVLDAGLNPVPAGVAGELYIAGVQVGRGYLGRPGLTAEKWLPDPFSGDPGARMYRTGDRARWSAHGEIEYLGRADFQVKIRGFRIEPGEIEGVLRQHPAVRDAVVMAVDGPGGPRLVAWVAASALTGDVLRDFV